jgi:hypothetical protein
MRDGAVFRFAAAVRDDACVTRGLRGVDGLQCLRERTNLVELHQDRVAHTRFDAAAQSLFVGDEKIVAHELHAITERAREARPSVPIVFG